MSFKRVLLLLTCWLWIGVAPSNAAGIVQNEGIKVTSVMDRESLIPLFPEPYSVGEEDPELPLWPLYKQEVTGLNLVGYIYESINYSSIPGFMGIPYNLLVVMDTQGGFLDVRVLFHREPMFVGGVGEQPMFEFVEQYKGLSLMQNIKFNQNQGQGKPSDGKNTYLDGISGATASIRILNQTLLSSALKVARARLGFGGGKDPDLIAKIDSEVYDEFTWQQLVDGGLVQPMELSSQAMRALFADTRVAWQADQEGAVDSLQLYVANVAIPSVGKNLLSAEAWAFLQQELEPGDHAFLVLSAGQYSFVHEGTIRGGISDRLLLRQDGLPIEMRDLDFYDRIDSGGQVLRVPDELAQADWLIYRVIDTSGIDIALPLDFELSVVRGDDLPYLPAVTKPVNFSHVIPERYYYEPDAADKTWLSIWYQRVPDLLILAASLVLLSVVLSNAKWLAAGPKTLPWFRNAFLLFTLFFIGWHAQAQLSIVNITGVIQALNAGGNLHFLLYDPVTLVLWLFVLLTLVVWGRGTFCGWLCPFGALQELSGKALAFLKLRTYKPSDALDQKLKKIKFLLLGLIIVSAFVSPVWTDRLVEIEPFKTSITFYFVRYWPYTLWALLAVLSSLFVYKGYCRYLCPLGAAMAIMGRLRWLNWLPRRDPCGSPCQLCKNRCQYNSIHRDGRIDYQECFQCLDCVVIYHDDNQCAPLKVSQRRGSGVKQWRPDRVIAAVS